jgi:hypothetical protein
MTDRDEAARVLILARLAESRAELRRLLDPQPSSDGAAAPGAEGHGTFPRSRTMKMLMSVPGLGVLGSLAAGLLISRPSFALRLIKMLPAGTAARYLMQYAMNALREKPRSR